MAEFIAESPRLLRLDLRENEIKTGGLMALSLALKVNNSLLRLDLDREPKKEAVSVLLLLIFENVYITLKTPFICFFYDFISNKINVLLENALLGLS